MNDTVAKKVEQIAAILQLVRAADPDWYEITTKRC